MPKLFRGSAPSTSDIALLKKNFGITKIISLDEESGEKISNICSLLDIKQEKIYLNWDRKSLLNLLNKDIKELLCSEPTYVHCKLGKDRTGLLIAILKCKYLNVKPQDAIKEAESLGFGIGLNPQITNLYKKIIMSCKPKDINNADIVLNSRDEEFMISHDCGAKSLSPYLSVTRQYPKDFIYNNVYEQYPTRESYKDKFKIPEDYVYDFPLTGIYNNDAGILGVGPSENVGGFISE